MLMWKSRRWMEWNAFCCPLTGLVVDLDAPLLDENLTGLVGRAVDLGRLKMVMVKMVANVDVFVVGTGSVRIHNRMIQNGSQKVQKNDPETNQSPRLFGRNYRLFGRNCRPENDLLVCLLGIVVQ